MNDEGDLVGLYITSYHGIQTSMALHYASTASILTCYLSFIELHWLRLFHIGCLRICSLVRVLS